MQEKDIKKISQLSIYRSLAFASLGIVIISFYYSFVDKESAVFITLMIAFAYLFFSFKYIKAQIDVWKNTQRFRFLSWYYISFTIIGIVVFLVVTILNYWLFHDILLSSVFFILFLTELISFYLIYRYALHFIVVKPDSIWIVKKQIRIIYPSSIAEIYYRNDILIFKLQNEKTIFINFLETSNVKVLRKQIADWLYQNNFHQYSEIIEELKSIH
ncbi:MAG: hypothetical protein AB1304_05495 [Bacteroidota bacterium]